nr:ras GTPase-activating protein 4-like [Anolis sagrei ordinatus]
MAGPRSSLFIRVVEAKNLPAKDITGSSDPYCIVKIDNEAIIRTATVWKTLFPFWGEEYEVHVPPTFRCVSFYVMDEDALSRDDVIGKVDLTQRLLAELPKGQSGWVNLSEVDPDEEVQGEIHLRMEILGRKLRCTVFDARDLARKDRNGASDPFVRIQYNGKTQETSVVKRSCFPRWNQTFDFDLEEDSFAAEEKRFCAIEVWDWDLARRNDFLGKVVFDIQRLEAVLREEGWFLLRPEKNKRNPEQAHLGSLHLQVQLRQEVLLPAIHYQPLVELLCQEVQDGAKGFPVPVLTLIEETTTSERRQEVSATLVKLFLSHGLATEFLGLLFQMELERTPEANTLFRSNSLASKAMESFLKVVGLPYLHGVLGPTVRHVFEEKRYVELDPNKVEAKEVGCSSLQRVPSENQMIDQSAHALRTYLSGLLSAACASAGACPPLLRKAFRILSQAVQERFPEEEHQDMRLVAVTSFLCLRFFSPAILAPKLFHLWPKHPDARTGRTLLLLAKAVQSVGNLEAGGARGAKEAWMRPLQPSIREGASQMRAFILQLIQEEPDLQGAPLPFPAAKEGPLFLHRQKGKGPLHPSSTSSSCSSSSSKEKLYFSFSSEALCCSKGPDSQKSPFLPLADILAAEKVDEKSFGSANVLQVIYANAAGGADTAYLQCKCVTELHQWLSALRKACARNPAKLCAYHPGLFRGDKWSCCLQRDRDGVGCDKTRHGVTLREWSDPLDPHLEAHLLFRHLVAATAQAPSGEKSMELLALENGENFPSKQDADPVTGRLFGILWDLEEIHSRERTQNSPPSAALQV